MEPEVLNILRSQAKNRGIVLSVTPSMFADSSDFLGSGYSNKLAFGFDYKAINGKTVFEVTFKHKEAGLLDDISRKGRVKINTKLGAVAFERKMGDSLWTEKGSATKLSSEQMIQKVCDVAAA